jgi:hypothetical protein
MLFELIGDEFRSRVKAYMQKAFEKGVPSLFSDLKELCRAEEKQKIIQEAAEEFREHYEAKDESKPCAFLIMRSQTSDPVYRRLGSPSLDILLYRIKHLA